MMLYELMANGRRLQRRAGATIAAARHAVRQRSPIDRIVLQLQAAGKKR
jgi:hypothetical protein